MAMLPVPMSCCQGEQLFVSYLDEGMGLKYRQNHLRFSYGFKCGCQRCVEEAEDEEIAQQSKST